jgi:hypothetical protein
MVINTTSVESRGIIWSDASILRFTNGHKSAAGDVDTDTFIYISNFEIANKFHAAVQFTPATHSMANMMRAARMPPACAQ